MRPQASQARRRHLTPRPPARVGALAERSVRSGTTELRVERVVTEERRTALGTEAWTMVVHGVVVNHGDTPLLATELSDAFRIYGRSGAIRPGAVYPEGGNESGWTSRKGTSEPRHVPPRGTGRVRVSGPGGRQVGPGRSGGVDVRGSADRVPEVKA